VDKVKRLILAYSLANSRGSRTEFPAPRLLEPFLSQFWMSVRRWGRITGLGSCASDLGSGISGGGGIEFCFGFIAVFEKL
jgi:hypothetical protein